MFEIYKYSKYGIIYANAMSSAKYKMTKWQLADIFGRLYFDRAKPVNEENL